MKLTLDDFQIIQNYPVHWGDMDAAQHVNNLVYLRWCESARIAYFNKMKMDTSFGSEEGSTEGPILGWQDCKYIFPMTYPDTAIVGVRVSEIAEDRFFLQCGIFSEKYQRIAAVSNQSVIPYDYKTLKKVKLPQYWIDGIKRLEKSI